jgi:hypothetical protein
MLQLYLAHLFSINKQMYYDFSIIYNVGIKCVNVNLDMIHDRIINLAYFQDIHLHH